ncbi:hypothetical protein CYMTET_6247, partial [Cymbomonas tetramitiformis]
PCAGEHPAYLAGVRDLGQARALASSRPILLESRSALALTKAMQRQGVQFLGPVIWLDQCTDLDELKSKLTQLKAYRCGMKGALMAEKSTLEVRLTALQTKLKFEKLDPFAPDVGLRISDVEDAWKELVESEQTYESMVNACLKKVLQEEELISQITKKGESLKLWAGTTSENIEEDTSAEPATLSEAEVALFGFEDVFVRSGLDAARGRLRRSCMEEGVGEARWGGTRLMVEGIRVGRGTGLQLMKKEHTAKVFKLQTLQDLVKQSEKDHNRVNVQAQKVLEAVEAVMTAVAPKIVEALCWGQGKVQKWREIEKKKMELSQDAERLAFECQSLAEEMQKGTNCDSVSDAEKQIQQVVQRWQAFKQDKGAHLQALQQRHDDLVGKGSRNPYSRYSVQDIQELLDVAEGAATNRGQQLKELHQLHTHNDELCKQFSLAAENLDAWLNEMKNKVDKAGSGEKNMEMQLAALDEVEKEVAVGSSKVALAEEADQAVIEAGIVENSFTDKVHHARAPRGQSPAWQVEPPPAQSPGEFESEVSMFELQMSWDLLNTMLREKRAVLEARLSMTKDRTGIQQREEMIELFRNFDKDGSGSLTGVELRAALTSQDVEIGDEKVEKLVKGGGMNQEKFVEFMIEHYKDTDTYEQMLEAFQTLSRAEPVIDKATLEKPPCTTFLKPEGVTFLCDQMPPAETITPAPQPRHSSPTRPPGPTADYSGPTARPSATSHGHSSFADHSADRASSSPTADYSGHSRSLPAPTASSAPPQISGPANHSAHSDHSALADHSTPQPDHSGPQLITPAPQPVLPTGDQAGLTGV